MSDFFDPNVTTKINKVIQSLDLDPHSNKIRDNLWERVNEGRDYYNILKDEIRKKKEQLKQLKERDEVCDIIANNSALENRVIELQEEIVKAKSNIETAEMQTEVLKSMITKRKEDRDLFRKRFILDYHPLLKYQQGVEKYIDDIVDLNKELQNYMVKLFLFKFENFVLE